MLYCILYSLIYLYFYLFFNKMMLYIIYTLYMMILFFSV
nr:MAG TPA: hypothetical protein [Caudoviricetes sp.]